MVQRALLPALLLAAGCDRVFDLSPAPVQDAPDACTARELRVLARADVLIAPDRDPEPSAEVMLLTPMNTALLQFQLDQQIDPESIIGLRVVLPHEPADTRCGMVCGSPCTGAVDQGGTLTLRPMRADWVETSVSWTCRSGADPCESWEGPGATSELGDMPDRGGVVATMRHEAGASTELTVAPAMLAEVRRFVDAGQSVSFQVTTADARFAMATHDASLCDVGSTEPVPELVLAVCQ